MDHINIIFGRKTSFIIPPGFPTRLHLLLKLFQRRTSKDVKCFFFFTFNFININKLFKIFIWDCWKKRCKSLRLKNIWFVFKTKIPSEVWIQRISFGWNDIFICSFTFIFCLLLFITYFFQFTVSMFYLYKMFFVFCSGAFSHHFSFSLFCCFFVKCSFLSVAFFFILFTFLFLHISVFV